MATFSLSDTSRRAQATGNNSAGPFSFSFQINSQTDLKVYVDSTLKTLTTHYTVTIGASGNGSISFTSGNHPTNSQTVTILSDVPVARTSVYTAGGNITAAALESDFDTQAMMLGDREERETRTVMAPVNDPTNVDMTLPAKADRLGKVLGFNSSTGNPEATQQVTGASVSVSALSAGATPTASVSVSSGTAAFALGIPAGATGATGAAGANSTVAGPQGPAGQNGADGDNTITVKDEGSALSTAASTINFVGNGVTASGTGAEKTVTITDTNTTYSVGDGGLTQNNFTDALKSKLDAVEANATADQSNAEIKSAYEANSDTNAFTDAEKTKLSGISTSANNYSLPTASGSTLGGIKIGSGLSIDGSGVVTASGGGGGGSSLTVQDEGSALSTAATTMNFVGNGVVASGTGATKTITVTDTNTTYSVGDGGLTEKNFTTALNTKLSGIETNATADQTNAEIRAAVEAATDSNVFTDADHSKLNAIAASATANPNALDNLSEDSSPQLGGNLDVNGNDIVSTSNGSIDLDPNGSGKVTFKGNSTRGAGQFVLNCENNSHGITIKGPPHSAGASYTLTLPDNDGSNGQSLITDGSGNTSWSTISGGSSYTLPIASYSTLGGIKVGSGLSVNSSTGLVNLNMPAATTSAIGGVLEDASGPIAIGNTGIMSFNSDIISADHLNVTGNGTTSQYLRSDGDGTFTWATPTDTNTTYSVGDGGLTQNNFTNTLKSKLDGIAASANNYSLPTASSSTLGGIKIGSGLSIDGSGVVTASGGGGAGADLYAANESSPSAQPSATGANAIAIGDSAIASGSQAVALSLSRASGSKSFAAGIGDNSTSYGASSNNTVAIGGEAKASSGYATAIGYGSSATAGYSLAMAGGTASGSVSLAIGQQCTASAEKSIAIGWRMTSNIIGKFAVATERFAANGDNCSASYRLQAATTNATATVMTTNQSSASSNNQIVAASDTAISFLGTITAIQNGAQAYASWKVEGLLVNDGGTTTLANSAITVIQNASNWGMALSADNTNNALAVTCTGEASHNIRWMSNIQTSEVTYS